ncbi:hypothetical protein GCM10011571_14410 [Marinithermofilum abyssi]|uniref:Uncharacterized protein n=1 Tax=Marinithermofilum abyssi TaxID=1571185 RepID=A0A8J2YD12_9BACL|nr:hypothetical protein GCM10011571_14410 [Marinithermofilum abyssi]
MKSTRFPFLHKNQQEVRYSMISSTFVTGHLSPFAGQAGKGGQVSTPALLCVGTFSKVTGNGGERE